MIDETLSFLAIELNNFIGSKDFNYRNKTVAFVSDLVDYKGEPIYFKQLSNDISGDFLILTLINIEEETVGKSQLAIYKKPDQSLETLNPDIKVNLYVMISGVSNMEESERYLNSIKVLSYAVGFFQYKNVFDKLNSPELPDEIEKLIAEMVSLTFEQQNHVWGAMGAKYLPSALFKIRMLAFREILDRDGDLRIKSIDTQINTN